MSNQINFTETDIIFQGQKVIPIKILNWIYPRVIDKIRLRYDDEPSSRRVNMLLEIMNVSGNSGFLGFNFSHPTAVRSIMQITMETYDEFLKGD
jgi:hypothetical protein